MSKKKKNKINNNAAALQVKKAERERIDAEKRKNNIIITFVMAVCGVCALAAIFYLVFHKEHSAHDTVVFTVGDEKVRKDEVNFCILQNVINLQIDEEKLSVSLEDMQSVKAENADEYYKNEILEMMTEYKVEYITAVKQGLTLTEDEKNQVRTDVTKYLSTVNSRVLNELGITKDCIMNVYEQRFLANKLVEKTLAEIDVDENDIDKRYATIYVMLFPKVETTDDGDYVREEDGKTPVMLSEDEILEQKNNAYAAYKELTDDGTDVNGVAQKYGVEIFSGEQSNMIDSFDEPFSDYAKELKEGEYSQVIDTSSCYAIVKMIDENNEQITEQIMETYRSDVKQEELETIKDGWYDELSVSKEPEPVYNVWSKITFYDFVKYINNEE